MTADLYIVTNADFQAWAKLQVANAPKDPVLIGGQLASLYGCSVCHSTDGTKKVGPTWLHLFNSTVTLSDGSKVKADENYLNTSITDPNSQVVSGYSPNVMPATFAQALTPAQIQNLIKYIESLK
jgi:cytochrome c oxidase subunit 2